jgi:hypothetical protein
MLNIYHKTNKAATDYWKKAKFGPLVSPLHMPFHVRYEPWLNIYHWWWYYVPRESWLLENKQGSDWLPVLADAIVSFKCHGPGPRFLWPGAWDPRRNSKNKCPVRPVIGPTQWSVGTCRGHVVSPFRFMSEVLPHDAKCNFWTRFVSMICYLRQW